MNWPALPAIPPPPDDENKIGVPELLAIIAIFVILLVLTWQLAAVARADAAAHEESMGAAREPGEDEWIDVVNARVGAAATRRDLRMEKTAFQPATKNNDHKNLR